MSFFKTGRINYGENSLKTLILDQCRYIDKTQNIYKLIKSYKRVFLARPRRFGKTLLVDTLSEIFQGNRELFRGLSIYESDYEWKPYEVIRLDMYKITRKTPKAFEENLTDNIRSVGLKLGVDLPSLTKIEDPSSYISRLLEVLDEQGKRAVILIDEYDYPVIGNISTDIDNMKIILEVMKEFCVSLKANDNYIHFLLLTGVTRIARSSIFSGMNNLKDISFNTEFCDLLGYTQEELETYFAPEISHGLSNSKLPRTDFLSKIRTWYNGYRFSDADTTVYNPADVHLFFQDDCKFTSYWTETGTPKFLVHLLSRVLKIDMDKELKYPRASQFFSSNIDLDKLDDTDNLVLLLYQTGYLTINSYDSNTEQYHLGFPNKDVEIAFNSYIVESLWDKNYNFFGNYILDRPKL